ncbi:hypothetical protein H4V97_001716 [Flavobacterium sp. CG_23.5]|nr:hypothetical protein [Flavobacterium sp. CG_9.10]MBP2283398.1 hypothetical protein [Flavobacterium sp. CG_23.5]
MVLGLQYFLCESYDYNILFLKYLDSTILSIVEQIYKYSR